VLIKRAAYHWLRTKSLIGLLPIVAMPKLRYANKIWLSIGLYLKFGHLDICEQNHGKLTKNFLNFTIGKNIGCHMLALNQMNA